MDITEIECYTFEVTRTKLGAVNPMPQIDANRKLLSISEAAQTCDLSHTYLGLLARQGIIEGIKVGNMWLIYDDSLQTFLSKPRKPGPKGPRATSIQEHATR